jgi:hypothetical protein
MTELRTAILAALKLSELAEMAYNDWPAARSENHPAGAYLVPLLGLENLQSRYGVERGEGLVRYFLANAGSWRGEIAREVKRELRRRLDAER